MAERVIAVVHKIDETVIGALPDTILMCGRDRQNDGCLKLYPAYMTVTKLRRA